ncbi:hypothetical protein Acr_00g0018010 [Actinidia rufa]|uniref:Uncharacterized protein n=1 Tax=Actinidia rufa TaxID=165716 RepID=A0A7J0DBD2_9ERIC|nr:hypothetical protein Acr_00g0018010 [Actinidia rufa]
MALWRVYKYSLSLSEFRNLFSLNNNPKPDSRLAVLQGEELLVGSSREGVPRGLRTWGIPDKHYNNPPRLYGDEPKVFEKIFKSVESKGRYSVLVLLDSKSFRRVFVSPRSMVSGTMGEEQTKGGAPSSSGVIRTELRRILPHVPDLTLLRWSGGKVRDSFLDPFMNALSSGSNSTLESSSNSRLPPELKLDEVVIGEKRPRDDHPNSPSKKGKVVDSPKERRLPSYPEPKKKTTRPGDAGLKATSLKPGGKLAIFGHRPRTYGFHSCFVAITLDLAINLENMGMDLDLPAEEDEAMEGGNDGEKGQRR